MTYIVPFRACCPDAVSRVGGKAVGLGFLSSRGFPVPDGFVVSVQAFRDCVVGAGVGEFIVKAAAGATTPMERQRASTAIRSVFTPAIMTDALRSEVGASYASLGDAPAVAVRSSATAEDAANASFAGQQDTYLFVSGLESLYDHIVRCWASLFTAQAIGYRQRFAAGPEELGMAVVVQRMVAAEAAGVLMTLDPTNGDRSTIYVEAALGLGEGVVRGDVPVDRFWLRRCDLTEQRREIARKILAHRLDPAGGRTRLVDVPAAQAGASALSDPTLASLADLAVRAEAEFGAPVDIEWAVETGHAPGQVMLLQLRAETVWSNRAAPASARSLDTTAAWDTLHSESRPDEVWTTTNVGEAIPGVATPLTWSLWGYVTESALRGGAYAIGALRRSERAVPARMAERSIRIFFGRPAMQAQFLAMVGDRMPGTSGPEVVRDIFGRVPDGLRFAPTRARWPIIAVKLASTFVTVPGRVRELAAATDAWWRMAIDGVDQLDRAAATQLLKQAAARLEQAVTVQATVLLGVVTPLYTALSALVARAGVGDTALLSGAGGAEMEIVVDIWRAAHGEIALGDVIRRHGFHGPGEGELSSRVWREDDAPIRFMLADYAAKDASADPRTQMRQREVAGAAMARHVLAHLPASQRPAARVLLSLAARRIKLRGVAKRSFLQALDVARASARRLGSLAVARGDLAGADDVFYLTIDELAGDPPADAAGLLRLRRDRRAVYETLSVVSDWQGMPVPIERADAAGDTAVVRGIGVSPGRVTGPARVLLTPDFAQVQENEILVTPVTDPSWSSVMFIASGLVVDIGGALSHAAIVARELGIPCVVNTRTGSRTIATGDLIRIDGDRGVVEVLERAITASEELLHD